MTPWEVSTEGVSEDGSVITPPGVYHAEVSAIDTAPSKKGERMLTLRLKQVSTGKSLIVDRLTFGDKARGLSIAKLYALGVERAAEGKMVTFEPTDLIGRRVAILVVHSDGTDPQTGNKRTEARIAAFGSSRAPFGVCGYCAEKQAMELGIVGEATAPVVVPDSEVPF